MNIAKLHFLTTHPAQADQACRGGIDWIQLRVKDVPYDEWKTLALATQVVCKQHNARLIVNDNVRLAQEIGADGVHLGKEDMAPVEVRQMLGDSFLIGGTANTFADIQRLVKAKVDYIGLGPFRFTTTKKKLSPVLGLEGYQAILEQCLLARITLPIVAIGGISLPDVEPLLQTGAHGIAISSAIASATDLTMASRQFLHQLQPLFQ